MEKEYFGKELLRDIIYGNVSKKDYKEIANVITGADAEDGGAYHIFVFQRVSDGKFFKLNYCDWDLEYNFDSFDDYAVEVFAKTKVVTYYE